MIGDLGLSLQGKKQETEKLMNSRLQTNKCIKLEDVLKVSSSR